MATGPWSRRSSASRWPARGVTVSVHHIGEVRPKELPSAGLYLFSSPGRFGKPIGGMRRFVKKAELPAGTKYAILTTEAAPHPDKTGHVPAEEEMAGWQRLRPVMNQIMQRKGLVGVAEGKVFGDRDQGAAGGGLTATVNAVQASPLPGSPAALTA